VATLGACPSPRDGRRTGRRHGAVGPPGERPRGTSGVLPRSAVADCQQDAGHGEPDRGQVEHDPGDRGRVQAVVAAYEAGLVGPGS
jgi:hypothetical protein